MAKIIEITAEHVSIGMDDGSIREIRPSDVSFIPQIGDEVEIYETENRIIVQKKSSAPQTPEGGIHINVANTNQTASSGVRRQGRKQGDLLCLGAVSGRDWRA